MKELVCGTGESVCVCPFEVVDTVTLSGVAWLIKESYELFDNASCVDVLGLILTYRSLDIGLVAH